MATFRQYQFEILNNPSPLPVETEEPDSWGWVHSYETSAGQDGPGWRFLLFLSGCPLRCLYCHNPDTWKMTDGERMSLPQLVSEMQRYRPMLAKGGITVSGGEPLMQPKFLKAVLRKAKEWGIPTAIDTSGFLGDRVDEEMMADLDLVLLDIKSWNPAMYKILTDRELEPTLRFARRLAENKKPIWLRYVLVPGFTDVPEEVHGLAAFAKSLGVVERVDVLPFHQMGRSKWHTLGLQYRLEEVKPPSEESRKEIVAIFQSHGLKAI
jgi:pyruvate formate lyase activating enzyme